MTIRTDFVKMFLTQFKLSWNLLGGLWRAGGDEKKKNKNPPTEKIHYRPPLFTFNHIRYAVIISIQFHSKQISRRVEIFPTVHLAIEVGVIFDFFRLGGF